MSETLHLCRTRCGFGRWDTLTLTKHGSKGGVAETPLRRIVTPKSKLPFSVERPCLHTWVPPWKIARSTQPLASKISAAKSPQQRQT